MASSVTDDLGRTITSAIDQSTLFQQLRDAMSAKLGPQIPYNKKGKSAEDLLEKLPQEIYKELEKKFKKDLESSAKYIKQIADYLTKKKGKGDDKGGSKLGDQSKTMIDHLGIISSGMGILISHVSSISKSSEFMAQLFGHRGSGYVHDIHVQAILLDIQRDLRKSSGSSASTSVAGNAAKTDAFIQAVQNSGMVAVKKFKSESTKTDTSGVKIGKSETTGSSGSSGIPRDEDLDVSKNIVKELHKELGLSDNIKTSVFQTVKGWERTREFTINELKDSLDMLKNMKGLDKHHKAALQTLFRKAQQDKFSAESMKNILNYQKNINMEREREGKFSKNYLDDLKRIAAVETANLPKHITAGTEIRDIYAGIGGEQVKNTTAIRDSLHASMGLTKEVDNLRNAYIDASRASENVAITGKSTLEYQQIWRKNLTAGIRDLKNLNRITQTGLNLSTMIGSSAEQTADTFAKWHLETGMSTNQMAQFSRHVQFAGKMTGITGDALLQAVQSARDLADAMRDAGTLTASAAGQFVQYTAAMNKLGSGKATLPILKALTSTTALYNEASSATQALLFKAAGTVGKLQELQSGTIMESDEGQKSIIAGLEGTLNDFTKQFGKSITDDISTFSSQQKMQLNMQLQSAYGIQLGEAQRLIETLKEGSMTFEDRLKGINDKLAQNLTQQERNVLLEQKRQMELQNALKGLTKLDEVAKVGKSMAEAMSSAGLSQDEVRKNLNQAITSVNESLTKAGKKEDLLDASRIEAALSDPAQYRELLAGINTAEQKAITAEKQAQDPALQAQQKIRELNGIIAENTGKLLQIITGALGSSGLIATSLLGLVATTNSGNTAIQKFIGNLGKGGGAATTTVGKTASGAALEVAGASTIGSVEKASTKAVIADVALETSMDKVAEATKNAIPPVNALGTTTAKAAPALEAGAVGAKGFFGSIIGGMKSMLVTAGPMLLLGLGLIVLFKAFEKAFEKTGGGLSTLTDLLESLIDAFGSIINVVAELLSTALVPVVEILQVAIVGLTKFFKTISEGVGGLLGSVGVGGVKKAEASNANASKGKEITTNQKKGAIPNPSGPMDAVTSTAKDVETSVSALPNAESLAITNKKAFLWLGGFAIIVAVWAVLAVKFGAAVAAASTAGFTLAFAIAGLAASLVIVVGSMALSFMLLNVSFDLLKQEVEKFNATIWGKLGYFFEAAIILGLFTAAFLLAASLTALAGLELAATLPALASVGIALGVFSLIGIAMGLVIGLMAIGFAIINFSLDYLKQVITEFNATIWGRIGYFFEAAIILGLFTAGFLLAASMTALAGLELAATLPALASVGIAIGAFSLVGIAIGVIVGLMAIGFAVINMAFGYLQEVMNDFNSKWQGYLGLFVDSALTLLAFAGAFLVAIAIFGGIGFAIYATATGLSILAIGVASLSLLGIVIAGIVALMAVGFSLMNSAFQYLIETVTPFMANSELYIAAFIASFSILTVFLVTFIGAAIVATAELYAVGLLLGWILPIALAGLAIFLTLPFIIASITDTLASGIGSMRIAFDRLAKATEGIKVESDIKLFSTAFSDVTMWMWGIATAIGDSLFGLKIIRDFIVNYIKSKVEEGTVIAELSESVNKFIGTFADAVEKFAGSKEKLTKAMKGMNNIPTPGDFKNTWFVFQHKMHELLNVMGYIHHHAVLGVQVPHAQNIEFAKTIGNIVKDTSEAVLGVFSNIDKAKEFTKLKGWRKRAEASLNYIPTPQEFKNVWFIFQHKMHQLLGVMSEIHHHAYLGIHVPHAQNLEFAKTIGKIVQDTSAATMGIFDGIGKVREFGKMRNWASRTTSALGLIPTPEDFRNVWFVFQHKMHSLLSVMSEIHHHAVMGIEKPHAHNIELAKNVGRIVKETSEGIIGIFQSLNLSKLRRVGSGWNADYLKNLPSGEDVKNVFVKIKGLLKELPAINAEIKTLQSSLESGMGNAKTFSTLFDSISDNLATIFNSINTSLNNGMNKITGGSNVGFGDAFRTKLMKALPSAEDVKKIISDLSTWEKTLRPVLSDFAKVTLKINETIDKLVEAFNLIHFDKLGDTFKKISTPLAEIENIKKNLQTASQGFSDIGKTTDVAIIKGQLETGVRGASVPVVTESAKTATPLADVKTKAASDIASAEPSPGMVGMNKELNLIAANTGATVSVLQDIKNILNEVKNRKPTEVVSKETPKGTSGSVFWNLSKFAKGARPNESAVTQTY